MTWIWNVQQAIGKYELAQRQGFLGAQRLIKIASRAPFCILYCWIRLLLRPSKTPGKVVTDGAGITWILDICPIRRWWFHSDGAGWMETKEEVKRCPSRWAMHLCTQSICLQLYVLITYYYCYAMKWLGPDTTILINCLTWKLVWVW